MKKALVYSFALAMLLGTLCGCGNMGRVDVLPTVEPTAPITSMAPNVNNGVVNDNDGIIGDNDTGRTTTDRDNDVLPGIATPNVTSGVNAGNNGGLGANGSVVTPSPKP